MDKVLDFLTVVVFACIAILLVTFTAAITIPMIMDILK